MRLPNRMVLSCAACITVLWAAQGAYAATLAPTKPTQAITVLSQTTSAPCQSGQAGRRVDIKQNPDGTTEPFTIPPKTVFVVTSVDAAVREAPASRNVTGGLYIVQNDIGGLSFATFVPIQTDADGNGTGTVALPSGVPVKADAFLCFIPTPTITGAAALVHGFFTKDK